MYVSLEECVVDGTHLMNPDDDGFCMYCGDQEPYCGAWTEADEPGAEDAAWQKFWDAN